MTSIVRLGKGNPRYPALLQELRDPPKELYAQGNLALLREPAVAIVGTRNPTPYGMALARAFSRGLVGYGLTVISGLAYGIDAEAHAAAVNAGGHTIAVLGSGLDTIHPRGQTELARRILEHRGLLLSEYPPGTEPRAYHFPARNRLVSGLAQGTLVVEAPEKSGALITARRAFEQNRQVFALPGDINRETFHGNHGLIASDLARLVRTPQEIAYYLNLIEKCAPDRSATRPTPSAWPVPLPRGSSTPSPP